MCSADVKSDGLARFRVGGKNEQYFEKKYTGFEGGFRIPWRQPLTRMLMPTPLPNLEALLLAYPCAHVCSEMSGESGVGV